MNAISTHTIQGYQDGAARLWDADPDELVCMISGYTRAKAIAWSPDGKLATVNAADGLIPSWEQITG